MTEDPVYCVECGQPVAPGATFCAACGARQERDEARAPLPVPATPTRTSGEVFCEHCGAPIRGESNFCWRCGEAGSPRTVSLRSDANMPDDEAAQPDWDSAPGRPPRRRHGLRLLILAIAGVVVLVVAAVLLKSGNTPPLRHADKTSRTGGKYASRTSLAAGGNDACALRGPGEVVCWGDDSFGDLGDGPSATKQSCRSQFSSAEPCSTSPITVAGITDATAIAVGESSAPGQHQTCALLSGGQIDCWGFNRTGLLGNGSPIGPETCRTPTSEDEPCSTIPVRVKGISDATAIATGEFITCALLVGGEVKCWGENSLGSLGVGSPDGLSTCSNVPCSATPVTVSGITDAVAISAGCAVLRGGTVDCWGDNSAGGLGTGELSGPQMCGRAGEPGTPCSRAPVQVTGIDDAIAVASGGGQTCALLSTGGIDCWGYNGGGQLGAGSSSGPETCTSNQACSTKPVRVTGIEDATAISAGGGFTCALRAGGTVDCWGNNVAGQLGDGTTTPRSTPRQVPGIVGATAIAAGDTSVCARLSDGSVDCWGDNTAGELGDGETTDSSVPVAVSMTRRHAASASSGSPPIAALTDRSTCGDWETAGTAV